LSKSPENSLKINFTNHPPHAHTHQPKIFSHFYPKKPLKTPSRNFPDPNFQVRFSEAPPSGKNPTATTEPPKAVTRIFPDPKIQIRKSTAHHRQESAEPRAARRRQRGGGLKMGGGRAQKELRSSDTPNGSEASSGSSTLKFAEGFLT